MKIKQLSKVVYDLIAAGEVVLAPVSVVKELVENALDAGASRINVETRGGGIERIRVADNGSGIARDDIELAFAPHATSKLSSADDLSKIETLGFRGEALASIAAVSRVTMITKTDADAGGTRVVAEGGSALSEAPTGADTGTDVTVEQLFFNIPARKKHLGDERFEGRKILEYISKAAVSRPDVAFRLVSDGLLVFSTLGTGDRLSSIAAAYGSKVAENLVPVTGGSAELTLDGFISGPLGLRSNRKGQHFFVNGRPVKNPEIEAAIGRAYREFAEPGRFPVVYLFVSADPALVDVNVHPSKSEISFSNSKEVMDLVENSIRDVLRSERAIPRLSAHLRHDADDAFRLEEPSSGSGATDKGGREADYGDTRVSTSGGTSEKVDMVDIKTLFATSDKEINGINALNNHEAQNISLVDDNILQSSIESSGDVRHGTLLFGESTEKHYVKSLNIGGLKAIAALFATYILATDGETIYIIDQHAAHERVNFERFMADFKAGETAMQSLLKPYLFTPPAAVSDLSKYLDLLLKMGYEVDEFGENTWAARSFPAFISMEEAEGFLLETLAALSDEHGAEGAMPSDAALERIMMRACKASVKANRIFSDEEIVALLDALAACQNPYTCPHGRPVFIKLTLSDIEHLFKRT